MEIVNLSAERLRRGVRELPPPEGASETLSLRAARLRRANNRLICMDQDGAEADIIAARYILCGSSGKLPGATLAEIAVMVRYPPEPPTRGNSHVSNSSRRPQRKRRS